MISASFNRDDWSALTQRLAAVMREESLRAAADLAAQGARRLAEKDREQERPALAQLWDVLGPTEAGDGSVAASTYSRAEDLTFYNKTSVPFFRRVKSQAFPVSGVRVLSILEGGARRHPIVPTRAKLMVFPYGRRGEGHWDMRIEVSHPGVTANHNVRDTSAEIVRTLSEVADLIAARVAARF